MKKLFFLSFVLVGNVVADVLPPPPATPAETAAGISKSKYVSPFSLTASGIGTQTNGITAATATNIVNGMRVATNFDTGGNAATATDALSATNRVHPIDQLNTSLRLPWVYQKMYLGLPVKVLFYGDDGVHVISEFIRHCQLHGIKMNGFGNLATADTSSIGNFGLIGTSSGVTTYASGGSSGTGLSPVLHYGIPNGGVISNYSAASGVLGWDMNMVTVKYWTDATLGSLSVQTNQYWNRSSGWGEVAVLDCSTGSWARRTTNLFLGGILTNGSVRLVATGTNVAMQASGHNTNLHSGWVFSRWTGGNMGFEDWQQSDTWSNSLYDFVADQDLVIFSDVDGTSTGGVANPITNFFNNVLARGYTFDVAATTSMQESNGAPAYMAFYDSMKTVGSKVPLAVYDTARWLWPTNNSRFRLYYTDANHASTMGHTILGQKFTEAILPSADLHAYGYRRRTTNFLHIPVDGRLRNDSGASALTISSPFTTWGVFYGQSGFFQAASGSTSFSYPVASTMFGDWGKENDARDLFIRLRVLTTNELTATATATFWIQELGTVGYVTGNSVGASSASFTVGSSGSTNFNVTPWRQIGWTNAPIRGAAWGGYALNGTSGGTTSFFIVGVDYMSVPRIPY